LINGGFYANTGCMTNGTFPITIPPMATQLDVIPTTGCAGGADVASWSVSGSS
jgi:hypothetical protein